MESRTLKRIGALAVVVMIAGGATWWALNRRPAATTTSRTSDFTETTIRRVVPEGTRIRVEVINTTMQRGLGRRATFYLRDAGFDVVRFAGEGPARDSSLVIDRTDHPEWARLASQAMGGARIESRPDSSRYVDITVLLGSSWRTPPKTFYP